MPTHHREVFGELLICSVTRGLEGWEARRDDLTNSMAYGTRRFKASPIIPILSRINPVPRIDSYFFKVDSNIVLGLPTSLFSVGLPDINFKALLPCSILATLPAHLHLLDLIILPILDVRYKLCSS
jgi:hypothetical protein